MDGIVKERTDRGQAECGSCGRGPCTQGLVWDRSMEELSRKVGNVWYWQLSRECIRLYASTGTEDNTSDAS